MVREPTPTETFVERLTTWVGSVPSLVAHSIVFIAAFLVAVFNVAPWDTVLLVLTTVVSLEAIYISILIQITVNRQARDIHDVTEDVEEIQEDIEEIQEDVGEMQEDVEEMQEDVEELSDDWNLEEVGQDATHARVTKLREELAKILAELEKLEAKP